MAVRLKRLLAPATRLSAGEWSSETMTGKPAVCCPGCGAISELEHHRVHEGGLVSPVWSCPTEPCPFMDFLSLEAWGEDFI